MTADGLWCGFPSANCVATIALRSESPSVEICVTTGALCRGFGKYFRYVARITRNIFVHAPKREASLLVVIELRLRAKWRPTGHGVTVFAGDVRWSVGVPHYLRSAQRDRQRDPYPHGSAHPSGYQCTP